jgi:hypothetical protein
LHGCSFDLVELAVVVVVVLLDHERAEDLIEFPMLVDADQLPILKQEGGDVVDPDVRMRRGRAGLADQA